MNPKTHLGYVFLSSNTAQDKLAAYFVHTFFNMGIASAILPPHTCDNNL